MKWIGKSRRKKKRDEWAHNMYQSRWIPKVVNYRKYTIVPAYEERFKEELNKFNITVNFEINNTQKSKLYVQLCIQNWIIMRWISLWAYTLTYWWKWSNFKTYIDINCLRHLTERSKIEKCRNESTYKTIANRWILYELESINRHSEMRIYFIYKWQRVFRSTIRCEKELWAVSQK